MPETIAKEPTLNGVRLQKQNNLDTIRTLEHRLKLSDLTPFVEKTYREHIKDLRKENQRLRRSIEKLELRELRKENRELRKQLNSLINKTQTND